MNKKNIGKLINPLVLIWLPLHPIVGWCNFIEGINHGEGPHYDRTAYLLTTSYLLVLLGIMFLTAWGQRRTAARYMGRYWLVSLLICVFCIFVQDASDFAELAILSILITPILPLMPFLNLLPVPWLFSGAALSLMGWLFCLWTEQSHISSK